MQYKQLSAQKFIILSVGLTVLLVSLLFWQATAPTQAQQPEPNDQFGLAFISSPDHLADEQRYQGGLDAGVRWDRWPLYWSWVEQGGYTGLHTDGQHDYDRLVAEEIELGIQPLVILLNTNVLPPSTLNEPIFFDNSDQLGQGKAINPSNAWAMFVHESVERYRPGGVLAQQEGWDEGEGVRHWEVWNEPDFGRFWGGTPDDYYRLLEVSYKTVKSVDPEATVVLGGLAFYEQPNWLGQMLINTNGDPNQAYFDVLAVHHYWSVYSSEDRLRNAQATLAGYGLADIPLWMTESGMSIWNDFPATVYDVSPTTPLLGTIDEQAAYVIQHAAMNLHLGVERYFHFMLHDDCGDGPTTAFGLRQNYGPDGCNPAQGKARPAYYAYQLVTDQFRGLTPLWREQTSTTDTMAFYRPDDQSRVLVVWSIQGSPTTINIPAIAQSAELLWIDEAENVIANQYKQNSILRPRNGAYALTLPPATNRNTPDPYDTRYHIGGRPYILVEKDVTPPTASVTSLSPISNSAYLVQWLGEDLGSGVDSYDVWVSINDGALEPWLINTTKTQAEYVGQSGQTYNFFVRARDRAGNQGIRSQTGFSTRRITRLTLSGTVLGPFGQPIDGSSVLIQGNNIERIEPVAPDGTWRTILASGDYTIQPNQSDLNSNFAPRQVSIHRNTSLFLTLPSTQNLIRYGDFEGNAVWNEWDWSGQIDRYFQSFDGDFAIRLGRGAGEPTGCSQGPGQQWILQQQAMLPADQAASLSFVRKIATNQIDATQAWLGVNVITPDGTTQPVIPSGELWQTTDWSLTTADLSAWQGQTIQVQFQVVRCTDQPFVVTLDRVSVGP